MIRALRAGIIGCGAIACRNDEQWIRNGGEGFPLTHAGAYKSNPATSLVACCDADAARLSWLGKEWGVSGLYTDYRAMLEQQRIEILSICTPTELHPEIVCAASAAGVSVIFCEKPLALDPEKAFEAIRSCERHRSVLAVNYFRRWNPTLQALAEDLASGRLGKLRRVNAYYTRGIVNNGTHVLDLLQWMAGPIRAVRVLRIIAQDPDDPAVDAICLTDSGVPCYLQACEQTDFNLLELDLLTDRGRVRIAENGRRIERYAVRQDPHYKQYRILDPTPELVLTEWQACASRAVGELVDIRQGRTTGPRCGAREAYEALLVTEALLKSARAGGEEVPVSLMQAAWPAPSGMQGAGL